ncbi:MAG: hypothetical protein V7L14_01880 [Nostoc sp.]|uniref:hypothetical protein n=1 Tax=Nostoc sp. TaxID=1180 RepID=UPI002FF83BB6
MANTFSTSQIIDEVKKVKLPSYKGFSDSDRIAKKMDKVELRGKRNAHRCQLKVKASLNTLSRSQSQTGNACR